MDVDTGELEVAVERTRLEFREIGEEEVGEYVESGESYGKAGGYAIQGAAGKFVTDMEGSVSNVVGLPVKVAVDLLERFGVVVSVDAARVVYEKLGYGD